MPNRFQPFAAFIFTILFLFFSVAQQVNAQAATPATQGVAAAASAGDAGAVGGGGAGGGGAGGGGDVLERIAAYTGATMRSMNDGVIPLLKQISVNIGLLKTQFLKQDDSEATANAQQNFAKFGKFLIAQNPNIDELQKKRMNSDLLNNSVNSVLNASFNVQLPPNQPIITPDNMTPLPYANDLVYSTLLEQPFGKDTRKRNGLDPRYNYIKNASGVNIYHPIPQISWQGTADSQTRYRNYYNTVMSAESFNAYILSQLYIDKTDFTKQQTLLIRQATDSEKWFKKIAVEDIGFVLRQLLMYESQIYVLLTEVLKFQKQMVTAQAVNNAVLIAANQSSEMILLSNAKGGQVPS